jgi:two-component system sensor histidine kinase KdpD
MGAMSTQDGSRADVFLRLIRRAQRGRLKVYLGYAAGVGKTYQMLLEGRRLKAESIDVVVGLVETHGRIETERLLEDLEVVPRRRLEYRGIVLEEMDVDAILARKPHVVLVDELAHTNAPDSRNEKRYEDVQDILAAGIHVITTLNVQHLESLYDTVEKAVGVKVRERIPDSVIAEADQIVNVDVSSEDLRQRLREGKVYTPERIEVALEHFFRESNLEQLRELTLRELASQIDLRRREAYEDEEPGLPDQVMACLSSRGPNSEKLLRYASRLAGRLNRNWYAVYVRTPSEGPTLIDSETQRIISETLTLAKQLGAIVFTYNGDDVVQTLLQFAKEYRVGHIVVGSQRTKSVWARLFNRPGMVERLVGSARGITVTVLDTREREGSRQTSARPQPSLEHAPTESERAVRRDRAASLALPELLSADRIVIWNEPVSKTAVLSRLAQTAGPYVGRLGSKGLMDAVLERETQGSTFLNEGVALPHARIPGVTRSLVALGLTRQGISDAPGETPIEMVFLIVSPSSDPDEQIRILALASRAAQSRRLREHLRLCATPDEVIDVLAEWKADD